MPTFQFKDPKYALSPPQEGTKGITNHLTVDSSYKQVIDNLPITSSTNLESIDFTALGVLALLISVNATTGVSSAFIRLLDVELDNGKKVLDVSGSGTITSIDAQKWHLFAINPISRTLEEKLHVQKAVSYLEEHYNDFKDVAVTYQGAVYKVYLSEPKNNSGDFDTQRHYIIADASEPVDRLKLVKYNSKTNFSHSYWFDAGTGSETTGLDSLDFTGSKAANTSKIIGKKVEFDGSDPNIVNVSSNSFDITSHGFVTGDVVSYFKDIYLNFDSADTSVVSVANDTITIANHGFRTGDSVRYIVKPQDIPIAPFSQGVSQLWIERVDDNTFKLRDEKDVVVGITGLGSGIHSLSVASVQFNNSTYRHQSTFKVIRVNANSFKLSNDGVNAFTIDAVGVGTAHCFQAGYYSTLIENQFIAVSEEVTFNGGSSGVNLGTDVITTGSAHGYTTGDTTIYTRGNQGTVGGLLHKGFYHVIVVSDTTLKLASSAQNAQNGTAINLTALDPGSATDHKLTTEYGTKIYRIDNQTIYTQTSDEVVFTNRTLKTPNWDLDPKADIMLAKVFKYQTKATVKTTESVATTTHNLKNIAGERFKVGATITSGIAGNPKILSAVFTENSNLGEDALITIDSAQTATINTAVVIESFAQEAYYNLDSGDRLEEDEAPKLSGTLNLNSQNITDGTTSIASFTPSGTGLAATDNNTSIPTSATVKAYVDASSSATVISTTLTKSAYSRVARIEGADFGSAIRVFFSGDTTASQGSLEPLMAVIADIIVSAEGGIHVTSTSADSVSNTIKIISNDTDGDGNGEEDFDLYIKYDGGYAASTMDIKTTIHPLGGETITGNPSATAYTDSTLVHAPSTNPGGVMYTSSESDGLSIQTDGTITADGGLISSGNVTIDTDTLVVDVANDRVGVNKASPSVALDVTGAITASGNITAFSDERLKENIKTLDGKKVLEMRGVEFTKDGEIGSGVIAQELEKVAPELVSNSGEYKSVAYGNIVGYLIEAVKDLQKQVDELKK